MKDTQDMCGKGKRGSKKVGRKVLIFLLFFLRLPIALRRSASMSGTSSFLFPCYFLWPKSNKKSRACIFVLRVCILTLRYVCGRVCDWTLLVDTTACQNSHHVRSLKQLTQCTTLRFGTYLAQDYKNARTHGEGREMKKRKSIVVFNRSSPSSPFFPHI